jgi:hypothetical protein
LAGAIFATFTTAFIATFIGGGGFFATLGGMSRLASGTNDGLRVVRDKPLS